MKLIVAGGRDVQFPESDNLVAKAFSELPWKEEVIEIVHGGASGIDAAAGRYFGGWKKVTVFRADWNKHGRSAGPIRNREMAEYADALLAVWDGVSKGTSNMIKTAESAGLKVFVYRTDKER